MKKQKRFMALTLLCCVLVLTACDEEKSDNNSLLLLLLGGPELQTYTADGVSFKMASVSGGYTFPTGYNDTGNATVANAFYIAETEVTYELWYKVYMWATTGSGSTGAGQYTFANTGRPGHNGTAGTETTSQEPVTTINWRDAMVWCNAITEWFNANNGTEPDLDAVYYTDSGYITPIRTSTNDSTDTSPADGILDNSLIQGSEDNPYVKADAIGFRLPTRDEWELAARYINGTTWLYGDHVSGDRSGACFDDGSILGGQSLSTVFGDYAVYQDNSGSATAIVKSKTAGANALGLYDMSGNVWEWCFEWWPGDVGHQRIARGGSWFSVAGQLMVGTALNPHPYDVSSDYGLRFVRAQ